MVVINTRFLNLYLSVVTHDMTEFSVSQPRFKVCNKVSHQKTKKMHPCYNYRYIYIYTVDTNALE
jgi:hypothetical protein